MFPGFEEFVASLNAHRARYLIVGSYAVAFHARPRLTKDIDVLVEPTAANARRVQGAIFAFLGAEEPSVTLEKLTNPRTLLVLGRAPVRIDILTSLDGLSFAAAYRRRVEGTFGVQRAPYIGVPDLIQVKEQAGRPVDREDVRILRRVVSRRER